MGDPVRTYALKGKLAISRSGWLLLLVPNAIGNGLFQALSEHNIEQPVQEGTGQYNAHVSVMRPEEVEQAGGPDAIKARGQTVGFNLGGVTEIANPGSWSEVSKCWVIGVQSPELMQIRRAAGLGEPKYPFHITFAIRKKRTAKQASYVYQEKAAATNTTIKESPIEGKGLFATKNFQAGDVINSRFMVSWHDNGKDYWDQSEECRYVNHSANPNCTLNIGDEYVQLVALDNIVSGTELTTDYAECLPVLGKDATFTYRGKPYDGSSSTKKQASSNRSKATDVILRNLYCAD